MNSSRLDSLSQTRLRRAHPRALVRSAVVGGAALLGAASREVDTPSPRTLRRLAPWSRRRRTPLGHLGSAAHLRR